MDERFPKYIRWFVRKLDFIGLPNLGFFICALAVLGFVGQTFLNVPMENFVFDPVRFFAGEWWRIFSFPVSANWNSPIWFLFYVMYIYFVMNGIEEAWGPGPLTVFTLCSYIAGLGGAFFTGQPQNIWFHVIENISLAFGTLFPNLEFLLFFIVPVKAKWLAMLAAALLLMQFITGSVEMKIFLLIVMSPYLLFFGPMFYRMGKSKYQVWRNRRRFDGK